MQVMRLAEIRLGGPEGEPSPTSEAYWIEFVTVLAGLPVTFVHTGEVLLATHLAEVRTDTHRVQSGTIVPAWALIDSGGNTRWVFMCAPTQGPDEED